MDDELYNIDAEKSVLGSVFVNAEAVETVFASLRGDDFMDTRNALIAGTMYEMYCAGTPIDIVTLVEKISKLGKLDECGGMSYLTALSIDTPTAANVAYYIDIVADYSKRRKVMEGLRTAAKAIKAKENGYMEIIQTAVDAAAAIGKVEIETIQVTAVNAWKSFGQRRREGLNTGFSRYDAMLNGLHSGELNILAARPSIGKTAFAVNIFANMVLRDKTAVFFSLESTSESIAKRILSFLSKVGECEYEKMSLEESTRFTEAYGRLAQSHTWIIDNVYTAEAIKATCSKIKRQRNALDLVIIDYLTIMDIPSKRNGNRAQEVGEVTRRLKLMAKDLDVPIVLLSQLSRESERRKNSEPMLSDLKDSGSIEQDADTVTFLHRDRDSEDTAVIVAKNREGMTGKVQMRFDRAHFSFYEDGNGAEMPYDNSLEEWR